jgi:hypothetical protein
MRPISENHGNQKNPICAGLIRSRWVLFLVLLPLFRWSVPAGEEPWERMAAPGTSSSRMTPALWQNCPPLTAGTKVKIFEAQGPGVITLFHVSALGTNFGQGFDSEASQSVKIRVFYDGEQSPSIEMPLMDFLADIQCQSAYFQTKYFSKVKEAHNFRLPMPFRHRIALELENPSAINLVGYTDVQWNKVRRFPKACGYLRVQYRQGRLDARSLNVLFEFNHPGKIMAHWLQFESEKSEHGETLCEGNQEIYLDAAPQPSFNYLGTEDVYGYSWGFKGTHFDQFQAILKEEDLTPAGLRIAALRCRDNDAICFQKSARWLITYRYDPAAMNHLGDTPIPFRHCVYYYSKE